MSFKKPTYTVKKKDDSLSMEFYAPAIIVAALGIIAMLAPIFIGGCNACPEGQHWDSDLGVCVPN